MDDLISRQAAKLKVARVIWEDGDSCYDFHDKCVDCLDDVPSAQPLTAYVISDEDGNIKCSNCGSFECWGNYCMNCGAKMRGKNNG